MSKLDRKFRLPRIWSNNELKKFAHLFYGDMVNVSGWKDVDKEGAKYKEYFINADSYTLTNYKAESKGLQGYENEIYLDLEKDLPNRLTNKFDLVFNHTVLEHIYNFRKAFANLCLMTKDIVIIVVPFLQEMHGEYGDYWRFTPSSIKKMFEENGLKVLYSSFNSHVEASVYLFFIASKNPENWEGKICNKFLIRDTKDAGDGFDNYVGCHAISNKEFKIAFKKKQRNFFLKYNFLGKMYTEILNRLDWMFLL